MAIPYRVTAITCRFNYRSALVIARTKAAELKLGFAKAITKADLNKTCGFVMAQTL